MKQSYTKLDKALAWGVHLFTASGLLAGFMAILAVTEGDFRKAMFWLIAAQIIDGIDGSLARGFRVSDVLPRISGKNIDIVVDFTNYAVVPTYFFYNAKLVDPVLVLLLSLLMLFVSAIYYGKTGMVSEDYHFIGFPVMWNMAVFFLFFVFGFSTAVNAAVVIFLAVLHFLPVKFAYPSRATRLKYISITVTLLMLPVAALIVWFYPDVPVLLKSTAVLGLVFFGMLAVSDTFFARR